VRALHFVWFGVLILVSTSATAAPSPRLGLPIDCQIGPDCFIQNYVDHRAGKSYQDYHCGYLTNDGHSGTDFRLRNHAAINDGVAVIAAAKGTVRHIRDGMPDVDVRVVGRDAVTDRGLGNAVVIDHGEGWRTIYGHMQRGSVTVAVGQNVEPGQKLGLIGLSGLTEFPHVHFEVRYGKRSIDPFVGLQTHTGCSTGKQVMWRPEALARLDYRPTFLLGSGFSVRPMKRAAMQYDLFDQLVLSGKRGSLYFGVFLAGLYTGDRIEMNLIDNTGKTLREGRSTIKKPASVQFRSLAFTQATPLRPGRYKAQFKLYRKSRKNAGPILSFKREVTLR
jgi:murein DD-endopeptidase MepM/ murein hydrolase activator NlpD